MSHCFRLLSIVLTASTAGLVSFIENRVQFVVPGQIHSRTCSKRSFYTVCAGKGRRALHAGQRASGLRYLFMPCLQPAKILGGPRRSPCLPGRAVKLELAYIAAALDSTSSQAPRPIFFRGHFPRSRACRRSTQIVQGRRTAASRAAVTAISAAPDIFRHGLAV